MSAFRNRREMNEAFDAVPPPYPATAAPATPGQDDMRREHAILRWAADRLEAEPTNFDGADERAAIVDELRRWADAALGVRQLPAELRGDGPCDDCGTRDNIVWYADSVFWNRVMGGSEATGDPGGIVCIPCFVRRVHAAGLYPTGWRLLPEFHWETATEYEARHGLLSTTPPTGTGGERDG